MKLLPASGHRRMPWKNGGGVTTEIAVSPAGAGLDTFDWRASMAQVASDGPFSTFPGIDRTLAVLDGAGIDLDVAGAPTRRLTRDSAPHAFPADVATSARLLAGPILDLNVMTRRGRCTHEVARIGQGALLTAPRTASTLMLLCHGGIARITTAAGPVALGDQDALIADGAECEEWRVTAIDGGVLYRITLRSEA